MGLELPAPLVVCIAVLALRRKPPVREHPFRVPFAPLTCIILRRHGPFPAQRYLVAPGHLLDCVGLLIDGFTATG